MDTDSWDVMLPLSDTEICSRKVRSQQSTLVQCSTLCSLSKQGADEKVTAAEAHQLHSVGDEPILAQHLQALGGT